MCALLLYVCQTEHLENSFVNTDSIKGVAITCDLPVKLRILKIMAYQG